MTQPLPPSILLVGCGDIAQRLAALLRHDYALTGLRRNPSALPHFIESLPADVGDFASLANALRQRSFDYVVVTLTPGERSAARYQQVYVEGMRNLLAALHAAPRLLFVSSTSVYEQDDGEVVDESTPAQGKGFSGRSLLEAETLVADSGLPATVVRFSGIYGARRGRLLTQVREGRVETSQAAQWTNRIHADDCARVLEHLIRRWQVGQFPAPCYIASDCLPVQAGEVWQWLVAQIAVPDPLLGTDWQGQSATGKRCSNVRLLQTGFQFLYSDFRAGYRTMLTDQ